MVSTKVSNLVNLSHENIIKHYNKLISDLLNHYSFVKNRKNLISIVHTLKMSAARTLALKYKKRSIASIFKKFGPNLNAECKEIKIYIPKFVIKTKTL